MADLTLHIASGPYDRIEALRYGAVKPDGITVKYETRIPVHGIFVGMAEREEFDVSEMSLSLYTTKRSRALASGSPPPNFAAMISALEHLLQILPRFASLAAFLCLMPAQWE